jgi:glutamine synthetase
MLACVCAVADGVNEGRYPEPELGIEYYEQEPEIPNAEPELPEDFEDGKFNLIL